MSLKSFSLTGRRALVTGASSGLGVAGALALAEAGAAVAVAGRRVDRLEATAEMIRAAGGTAVVVEADVSTSGGCVSCVERAAEELGGLDVLLNNAGVATSVPTLKETDEQLDYVLNTNLRGAYVMARESAKVMSPGASIINVASVNALVSTGLPQAAYSASKAGLLGMTRDLAAQWTARKGIRVNAVLPGAFDSEMTQVFTQEWRDTLVSRTPAGRFGRPEEFGAVVVFLASDAASFVTGASLPIDGGFSIR